jgi:hypothetical protein
MPMVMNINKKHVDRQTPECRSLAERLQTVARRRRREVDRHAGCMQVACRRSVTAALDVRGTRVIRPFDACTQESNTLIPT